MKVPSWIKPAVGVLVFLLFGGGTYLRLSRGIASVSTGNLMTGLIVGTITGGLGCHLFNLVIGKVTPPRRMKPYGFLKYVWDTIFRLFPHPEALGLYQIGHPDDHSPIIATGNFRLTVKRVQDAIDFDCWLLICNSRGINIWCSALAGHFGTVDVIEALEKSNLAGLTKSRRVILPQLCAANVFPAEIKKKTGFLAEFGPVYADSLNVYFKNPETEGIRSVDFKIAQRVEMAIGSPIILTILLLAIFNFFDLAPLLYIIPFLYLISIIHAIIFPFKFIRNTYLWALFWGLTIFALVYWFLPLRAVLSLSLGTAYLATEFVGWSPLVKYAIGKKPGTILINPDKCIGCGICQQVCPRDVFEIREKADAVRIQSCEVCLSCIRQCPEEAIELNK